ncbi:hypothetical protein CEP51_002600 [Fusarium floridanum]|uniref:Heterokaryon incompatibility domain-containing protein n=1 Tax=Fusarium floridanum TaxID=1325733 RepID=A0A428SAL4_9HYPO|nr:hypothetical protein CEP51_002600 [Fusarium floridanum]
MSELEPPGYKAFLRYWSFDSLDVKEAEHKDSTNDDESQDQQRSGPAPNFAGARSYLRFLREPDAPEYLTDDSDGPKCTGNADEVGESFCDACSVRAADIDRVKYFHVLPESPLLLPAPSEDESEGICVNLHHNDPDLWAEEPNFYRALAADGMGFLSQVAHVCLYARLSNCNNARCLALKQKMQNNGVPKVDSWPELTNWALTAMSCQHHHRDERIWGGNLTSHSGHTHIASAVAALSMVLSECSRPCYGKILFRGHLDGVDEEDDTLLSDVWDLLYWMISIQYNYSVGPDRFGRWGSDMLSTSIESRFILRDRLEQDLQWLENADVCKFRVWNFLDVGDRDDADLLAVVGVLKNYKNELGIEEKKHKRCTPGFCQQGNMDSTKVTQWHSTEGHNSCEPLEFDLELVNEAVVKGHSTAWICDQKYEQPELIEDGNDYVAISHVWSDGTGVGDSQRDNKSASMVNSCLWEYWQTMVDQVWKESYNGVPAVWWDTISIPRESGKRAMALRSLHRNYSGAKCTIVHDKLLANMTSENNAVRCLALVLSNWFSRGWTALELQMSKQVWVVFGNTPIPLEDILAKSPATAHPVHWLATTMIKRLKAPIDDVGDILHILKSRSTSWARDKTIIAALLADVPNFNSLKDESVMTQDILRYLGKIPSLSLLHGEPTMKNVGPWSWCPSTLFDMPVAPSIDVESRTMSDFLSLLDITPNGGLNGKWLSRFLHDEHDSKSIHVFGRDNSSSLKVRLALQQWEKCHLLRPQSGVQPGEPALLVKMIREMDTEDDGTPSMRCQYIGAVWEGKTTKSDDWQTSKVLIGPKDESGAGDDHWEVYLPVRDEAQTPTWLDDAAPVDDWLEEGDSFIAQLSKVLLGSDEDSPVGLLRESILKGNTQSAQYQLESTLSRDVLDFGMIDELKSTADELDLQDGQLSDIMNGLWLLGDYALKLKDFEHTRKAYFAAHGLAKKYLDADESRSEDIPAHTDAMLWYQRGLALLLKGDYQPAIECLQQAIPGKLSRVTNQVIPQRKTRNSRRNTQYHRVSSYMVARDWESESEAWYRVRRSTLGALILLSADPSFREQYDNLKTPEHYFLDSIRREDRALFSNDEQGNSISELGFGIIRYCLQEKGTDENELPQYSLKEIQQIAIALKSVLEKFDRLFQKEHILCYISSLCFGVAAKMTAESANEDPQLGMIAVREYEALANAQFKRVREDLIKVLPDLPESGPQGWALYNILTSHCSEIEETVAEE